MPNYQRIRDCIIACLPEVRYATATCTVVCAGRKSPSEVAVIAIRRGEGRSISLIALDGVDGLQTFLRVSTPVGTKNLPLSMPTVSGDGVIAALSDEVVLLEVLGFFPDAERASFDSGGSDWSHPAF